MFTHPPALPQLLAATGPLPQKMKLTKLWSKRKYVDQNTVDQARFQSGDV